MKVTGNNVYGTLKYESGVHRVQRVPQTETQGRVHTSAASVAVLPEAEEFDVEISMNDIRKDIFCASGPRRTVGQYDLLGDPPDAHPDRYRRAVPGPEIAAQELRQGFRRTSHPASSTSNIRNTSTKSPRSARRWFRRRPFGQDPHLQLPAGAHHRPPHQLHDLQPVGLHGRRHPGLHRPSDRSGKRRAPQGERTLTHLRHGPSRRIRRGSLFGRGANSAGRVTTYRTDRPAGRHAGICPPRGTCAGSGSRRTSLPPGRKQRRQNRAPLDGATSDARGGRRPLPKERLRRSDPLGLEGGPLKAIFRDRNPFCG